MSKGNEDPVPVKGETLKSKESLYFPSVQGNSWSEIDRDIRWDMEDVIDHVFPEDYQERSNRYACSLMEFLTQNPGGVGKDELTEFLEKEDIPKSTAYNVIIPKLVRFGLLEREREANESNPGRGWFMVLKPSKSFASHLEKLASEWRSIYKTALKKGEN
ncbi:MAG: hypothetical protein ABEJ72_04665 [Candidatus Aenigmatarchaeota archaeon]